MGKLKRFFRIFARRLPARSGRNVKMTLNLSSAHQNTPDLICIMTMLIQKYKGLIFAGFFRFFRFFQFFTGSLLAGISKKLLKMYSFVW